MRSETLRQDVAERATHCCEYCRLPERYTALPFQLDHIIAEKHGGETSFQNLAYSRLHWNTYKGSNIAGWSVERQEVVRLYHPRKDAWYHHFHWNGPFVIGKTDIGKATVHVLSMNHPDAVAVRRLLLEYGESFE